jgi:hypothetical protein
MINGYYFASKNPLVFVLHGISMRSLKRANCSCALRWHYTKRVSVLCSALASRRVGRSARIVRGGGGGCCFITLGLLCAGSERLVALHLPGNRSIRPSLCLIPQEMPAQSTTRITCGSSPFRGTLGDLAKFMLIVRTLLFFCSDEAFCGANDIGSRTNEKASRNNV